MTIASSSQRKRESRHPVSRQPACRRILCVLLLLCCALGTPQAGQARAQELPALVESRTPVVDPLYIYQQLAYLTSHFQQREAGYAAQGGHDRFAAYWSQEMVRNLQGFGPRTLRDTFASPGWRERSARLPAVNVEVSIAGLQHPEQEVIIGCHYDGKANSGESAFDDTSGCAYELGVAQALGTYWRTHQLFPARTIRFVIFDAEEQGLFGSFHYLNSTISGDLGNVTAMFNQEQSGINYPARYLGQLTNPFLPDYIDVTPLQENAAYAGRLHLTALERQNVIRFRQLFSQAVPAAFAQLRAEGYTGLDFYDGRRQNSLQPIFRASQQNNIHIRDDPSSNSDHVPFIYAGLPVATLTGDQSYYEAQPPVWAYPYDLPEDTLALLNVYTAGSTRMSPALALALALPAMLTAWMLNQPAVGGSVAGDSRPVVLPGDIGQVVVGQPLTLTASAFAPLQPGAALSFRWELGDGTSAVGAAIRHTYRASGAYTLVLTVTSSDGIREVRKTVYAGPAPVIYSNPYAPLPAVNTPNPAVQIPASDASLPAQPPLAAPFASSPSPATPVQPATPVVTTQLPPTRSQPAPHFPWLLLAGLLALALALGLGGLWLRKSRSRGLVR
jgi:hypothetical protein